MTKRFSLNRILFLFSVIIFLFSLLYQLELFPIYFFIDEAIQAVKAEELIRHGLRNSFGEFLPVVMHRFNYWDLGLTVYLNIPGLLLFGKKIWVVRGTTVVFSLMGAVFTSLILKNVFKIKNYWLGILFLAAIPIYFLHSRTGFEIVIATAFYAGFIYYYFLYRTGKPWYLLHSIFFAVISFYSVNALWLVIGVTLTIFALTDLKFHWQNKKIAFAALLMALILFSPFIRWQIANFSETKLLLSKYKNPIAVDGSIEKGSLYMVKNYLKIFDPIYLFVYDNSYHPRHYLKGYGYFPIWSLPIILIGLIYALIYVKNPTKKILLISLFTSPLGGALVEPGPSRIMAITVPLACLFGLGIKVGEDFLEKLKNNLILGKVYSLSLFISLALVVLLMTNDALHNGPTWFQDYSLYGMQWGVQQMLSEGQSSLSRYHDVIISTGVANGLDILFIFFLSPQEQQHIRLVGVDQYQEENIDYTNTVFIIGKNEFENLLTKPWSENRIRILDIIYNPNGTPQFYKLVLEDVY